MRCQHWHFSIKPCRFSAYQGASFQVQVKKKFTKGLDKVDESCTKTSLSGHSLLRLLHKSSTHWLVWNGILYFTDLKINSPNGRYHPPRNALHLSDSFEVCDLHGSCNLPVEANQNWWNLCHCGIFCFQNISTICLNPMYTHELRKNHPSSWGSEVPSR